MKTNQIMIREEGFVQRTKDGYFNANSLISSWNEANPHKKKVLGNFQALKETKDFIEYLKTKESIEKPFIAGRGNGDNVGTWMHPKLYIDLAMWVSLEFKSKVIDYVLDGLITSRHDAGDYFTQMSATIMSKYIDLYNKKPPAKLFIDESKMIKQVSKIKGERNEMSQKELDRITILQKVNCTLIKKNVGRPSRIKQLTIINDSLL